MPKIHPTAIVDPSARLADDVDIGPYCVVEADVVISAGTVLRSHAIVRRYTTLGEGNFVDSFVVLWGEPQDLKFNRHGRTFLVIGDRNVFRENVTISRATTDGTATTVGSRTYWMAGSHAGHNATIEDEVILVNNASIAGHATIHRGAILSGNVLIHQFVWVGDRCMSQGMAAVSMHVPPYCMFAGPNTVVSLNTVGLRRAPEITEADRQQLKLLFDVTYRKGLSIQEALERMNAMNDLGAPGRRFREFVHKVVHAEKPYRRGLCTFGQHRDRSK